MVILMVVASGFVAFTAQDLKTSDISVESTTTYYLAEAGLDYGLWLLKYNMSVFPWQNLSITMPAGNGWTTSASNKPDNFAQWDGSHTLGDTINLSAASSIAKEHVVISDLTYRSAASVGYTTNWWTGPRLIGTFRVTQGVTTTSTPYTLTLTSTGYIRQIPAGVTLSTSSAPSIDNTWTIRSQRTVNVTLQLSYLGTTQGSRNRLDILKFYEKFR